MNPLYQQIMGAAAPQNGMTAGMQFTNPIQKMNYIMQAMRNPSAFVRQHLPNIPDQAYSDPTGNGVLQYMIQNFGVTQQDIQNAARQMPKW